jgi:hypothetical protein
MGKRKLNLEQQKHFGLKKQCKYYATVILRELCAVFQRCEKGFLLMREFLMFTRIV